EPQELRGPVRRHQGPRRTAAEQGAGLQIVGESVASGSFTFVLHSHLPWVLHHGRWPHGVDWLNEAMAETYLPLARVLHERTGRGPLGVTIDFSPVLCEQLAHP